MIVEDRRLLRGALIALLAKERDVEVVAAVACDRVIEMALQYRAQVVVLDLELAGEQGLTAIRRLHARLPNCRELLPDADPSA